MRKKNIDILEHIKTYCEDIMKSVERFGNDKAVFDVDKDYRNSVCMSFLQIGELTGHLTEDFREKTKKKIFWPAIQMDRFLEQEENEMAETECGLDGRKPFII